MSLVHKERIDAIKDFYDGNYKKLMLLPATLLLLAIIIISTHTIPKDIDLSGGTRIEINTQVTMSTSEMEKKLAKILNTEVRIRVLRSTTGTSSEKLVIETGYVSQDKEDIRQKLLDSINIDLNEVDHNIQSLDATISSTAFRGAQKAVIIAFFFMGLIILLVFKEWVVSSAVMIAAFSDIIETYATMSLIGIKLSLHTIAALLMLIGYSVDSDILLTMRVVKRKEGRIVDRIFSAMSTGLTMEATTITAVIAIYLFTTSPVLKDISTVLFIGIIYDIINTWIQNAGILKYALESRGEK